MQQQTASQNIRKGLNNELKKGLIKGLKLRFTLSLSLLLGAAQYSGPAAWASPKPPTEAATAAPKAEAGEGPAKWANETGSRGQTPLHLAAAMGLEGWVQILLKAGADIHRLDADGLSPLHLAARNGQTRILTLLLSKYPESVDMPSGLGQTPLYLALKAHQKNAAEHLISAGAQILQADSQGVTPLLVALIEGQSRVLSEINIDFPKALRQPLKDGRNCLHMLAGMPNQEQNIKQLLEVGLDPRQRSLNGRTPLVSALRAQLPVNAWLLRGGLTGDPKQDYQAWQALQNLIKSPLLAQSSTLDTLTQLLKAFQDGHDWLSEPGRGELTLLQQRIQERDLAAIKFLLAFTGTEQRNSSGQTPLIQVVSLDPPYPEAISLLLDTGASVKATDNNGNTALHLAVLGSRNGLVELLLPRYASLPVNNQGKTPLDLARETQNAALVDILRRLYIRNLVQ